MYNINKLSNFDSISSVISVLLSLSLLLYYKQNLTETKFRFIFSFEVLFTFFFIFTLCMCLINIVSNSFIFSSNSISLIAYVTPGRLRRPR